MILQHCNPVEVKIKIKIIMQHPVFKPKSVIPKKSFITIKVPTLDMKQNTIYWYYIVYFK